MWTSVSVMRVVVLLARRGLIAAPFYVRLSSSTTGSSKGERMVTKDAPRASRTGRRPRHRHRGASRRYAEVLVQSLKDTATDNGPQWAAAIAYYGLLSTVPLLLCCAALVAFVIEPQVAVDRLTNLLGDFVPQSEATVEETVNGAIAARGQVGALAFVALLWTGTRVFDSLTRAMNVAFDVDDDYSPLQRLGIQIAMLLSVGVLFVVALAAGLLIGPLWQALGSTGDAPLLIMIITWLARVALLFVAFALLYRFVPRRRCATRAIVAGALAATILTLAATSLFRMSIERFGTYNLLYGSLAVVAILIVWVGIVSFVTVFGGEVVSHAQEMLIDGRSPQEVGRRHAARSPRQRPVEGDIPDPQQAVTHVQAAVRDRARS
jgi:membrane protein